MPRPKRYAHQYSVRADDKVHDFLHQRGAKTKKAPAVVIREVLEEQATKQKKEGTKSENA